MGYRRAEEILPKEMIEMIQQYVDGQNIYIPRKDEHRASWGSNTSTRKELAERNQKIYADYCCGFFCFCAGKSVFSIGKEHTENYS